MSGVNILEKNKIIDHTALEHYTAPGLEKTFCGQGESFRCGRPIFLPQKSKSFSKIILLSQHGKGEGWRKCRQKRGGHFFAIL